MIAFLRLLLAAALSSFRARYRLEIENLVLRHQINVLRRAAPKRVRPTGTERLLLVWLYRLWPDVLRSVTIVRPETVVRWHRQGWRAYWRWKSRGMSGRPKVEKDIRDLIREISRANPLWGAPRIMENSSSLASISDRPAWPSTWSGDETRRPKAGGHSSAISGVCPVYDVQSYWRIRGQREFLPGHASYCGHSRAFLDQGQREQEANHRLFPPVSRRVPHEHLGGPRYPKLGFTARSRFPETDAAKVELTRLSRTWVAICFIVIS